MYSDNLAPGSFLIIMRDQGNDRGEIDAARQPQYQDEQGKVGKPAAKGNEKEDQCRDHEGCSDRAAVSDISREHSREEEGDAVPC